MANVDLLTESLPHVSGCLKCPTSTHNFTQLKITISAMKLTGQLLATLSAMTMQFHHWMVIWIHRDRVCQTLQRILPAIQLYSQPAVDWLPWGWVQQKNIRQPDTSVVSIEALLQCWQFFPFLRWKLLEVSLAIPQSHIWAWHSLWKEVDDGGQLFSKTGTETGMWMSYTRWSIFLQGAKWVFVMGVNAKTHTAQHALWMASGYFADKAI